MTDRDADTADRAPEFITCSRIRLRRPSLSDAPAILEYGSDSDVARYADWPLTTSIDPIIERMAQRHALWESGKEFYWVITELDDDWAIGGISCAVNEDSADFGFLLNRRFWGNGYATEAARAVVDWAFSVPSIKTVQATCDVDNAASIRVLEKAGLSREQTLRRAIVRPNLSPEPRDAYVFSKRRT